MRIARLFVFAFLYLTVTSATAAEYDSVKSLMLEAIDATGGAAHGVIVGPIARKFAMATGSMAPVVVDVTTLKRFEQEGCCRLNVRMMQANVPTREGKLAEFGIDYRLNLCRDGSPPTEGIDFSRGLAPQPLEQ